jgi:CheY-like chemotaxis protein
MAVLMPERRVLVVDDDPVVLESIALLIMHLGHVAEIATNGQIALRKVDSGEKFDLVLVDFKMPEMDGKALAHELKIRCPALPIVLVTGAVLDTCSPDIACVLYKPFSLNDLGAVIAGLPLRVCKPSL